MDTEPDSPAVDKPEAKETEPLTPFVPELADEKDKEPLDVAELEPVVIKTSPPVVAELLPAKSKSS